MIPQYRKFMLPILKICKDGGKFRRSELANILADQFKLTQAERDQLKPSGGERLLVNRVGWAIWYLKKAGLLNVIQGVFSITENGKDVLRQNLEDIDRTVLMNIPTFKEFMNGKKQTDSENGSTTVKDDLGQSPEDMIISGYENIKENVKQELLEKSTVTALIFLNDWCWNLFERSDTELTTKCWDIQGTAESMAW